MTQLGMPLSLPRTSISKLLYLFGSTPPPLQSKRRQTQEMRICVLLEGVQLSLTAYLRIVTL